MLRRVLLLLFVATTLSFHLALCATKDEAYQLYNDQLVASGYNKYVRPATDSSVPTNIYMSFSLVSLVDLDEKNQFMKTSAKIELDWDDLIFSWDPNTYGGLASIFTAQKNVWLPDITVDNSVTKQDQIGFDELPVRIRSDGIVLWSPTVLVTTSCDIIVTYYPFDTQSCYIDYVTLVTTWEEVDINIDRTEPIDTKDFSKDGTWDLVDYWAKNLGNEESKTKIRFQLLLKRRTTFYVINIILPVLFLSLTATLVFALPADSGEKMGTAITVLLAYAVYLTIVSAYLPNTSLQTSILAMYLTILLGVTALSVVATVFILRVYNTEETHPVGPKVTNLTKLLQTIMCLKKGNKNDDTTLIVTAKNSVAPHPGRRPQRDLPQRGQSRNNVSPLSNPPQYEEPLTWKTVGETLDWFCFITFTSLVLIVTATCMCILAIGGYANAPTLDKTLQTA